MPARRLCSVSYVFSFVFLLVSASLLHAADDPSIDRLRKDPPDAKELKGVQNYMGGIFVLQNTSNQGIIGQLSFVDLHGLKDDYLKTYVQKVNSVTRQDVQRITESYLNPARMTYVVVGDKAKIEESLKAYPPK